MSLALAANIDLTCSTSTLKLDLSCSLQGYQHALNRMYWTCAAVQALPCGMGRVLPLAPG
jgi:hypothetical protein